MPNQKGRAVLIFFLIYLLTLTGGISRAEEKSTEQRLSEQELATEKFLSNLEAKLAYKFFDYRQRPVVRVAVFDFNDGAGNVSKGGREIAEKISRRLWWQKQFTVLSREKVEQYLQWMGMTTLFKMNAQMLYRWQKRINTLDPGHGLHVLISGEVQKGVGRSLRLSASLINFETKIGSRELEHNILDLTNIIGEIPLPTEQALKEALEIVTRGEIRSAAEGRLLILASNKGHNLMETDYVRRFTKEQPSPWAEVPLLFIAGKEEGIMPENVKVGLDRLSLSPLTWVKDPGKQLQYSFLHGKCSTNLVYFDEIMPAQSYRLVTALTDPKSYETRSLVKEVPVYPGVTTLVVLSFYIPSEKERLRSKQTAQINIFQLWGKGMEVFPEKW
ncbi:MAG: hypothetical protein ACPL5I_10365 [Thermodesulfobacteriota bacterium]